MIALQTLAALIGSAAAGVAFNVTTWNIQLSEASQGSNAAIFSWIILLNVVFFAGWFYIFVGRRKASKWLLATSCLAFGGAFSASQATGTSDRFIQRAHQKSCDEGVADACFRLGNILRWDIPLRKSDSGKAMKLTLRSCELGSWLGCSALTEGQSFRTPEGLRLACEKFPKLCEAP